ELYFGLNDDQVLQKCGVKAHEVKGKKPNSIGLYDMIGNVQEWCWDWYSCSMPEPTEYPHFIYSAAFLSTEIESYVPATGPGAGKNWSGGKVKTKSYYKDVLKTVEDDGWDVTLDYGYYQPEYRRVARGGSAYGFFGGGDAGVIDYTGYTSRLNGNAGYFMQVAGCDYKMPDYPSTRSKDTGFRVVRNK
ncbi:MAG: SUMF1/EgtB/PvdO family nonheme iron enzyme, partial [Treponema sp.]|nr:SUMF1/EgtB/PvdO family nonheme iron enzyme [Treponema sp.]